MLIQKVFHLQLSSVVMIAGQPHMTTEREKCLNEKNYMVKHRGLDHESMCEDRKSEINELHDQTRFCQLPAFIYIHK